MQTFLPYESFVESAKCLDYRRLGKQRLETYDIYGILTDFQNTNHSEKQKAYLSKRYPNHPAILMWRDHENWLALYGSLICSEWRKRGYNDKYFPLFTDLCKILVGMSYPKWLEDETFHASHRSNLLRKNPEHYAQFNWEEEDNLPYVWPV